MDRRTIYIIVAVVVVLAILGYALGWFWRLCTSAGRDRPNSGTSRNGASANSGCASRACAGNPSTSNPSTGSARAVATAHHSHAEPGNR